MKQIIKRLEIIKSSIAIDDEEIIELQIIKLKELDADSGIKNILKKLENLDYGSAMGDIENYIKQHTGMVEYVDSEVLGLKLELKSLEKKLQSLSQEKTEYLNDIEEFNTQYNIHLGDITKNILNLKKDILYKQTQKQQKVKDKYKEDTQIYQDSKDTIDEIKEAIKELEELLKNIDENHENYEEIIRTYNNLKKELNDLEDDLIKQEIELNKIKDDLEDDELFKNYEEAKTFYEEFHHEHENIKEKQSDRFELKDEDIKELKIMWKKACRLCHPDIVTDELKEKANEIKYSLDKKELTIEVLKAYNSAVVAKEFVSALEKAKIAINQIIKSADAFHKEGLVTKIDVNEAKVYQLNLNSQLTEAKNNFQLALAYLRFLSSDETISDVENLENIAFEIPQNNLLYTQALENRDEIKMQDINLNATKKNIEIANGSYYPTVYSHLEYGFNDNTMTFDDEKDYYMALVGINLTLFDDTRDIEKQKSKIEYAKASLNSEKLKDAIKLEVQKTILNLETKEKILEEKIEAKNLANDVLEQSKLLYQNHLISMTTLLSQEANFRKNEALLIEARYEKSLALAKINLALGKTIYKENNQ